MLLKPPQLAAGEIKVDLDSCLKNYATPEIMKGANQRFCEKCQKLSDSTRFYKLIREPEILMLHIQRPQSDDKGYIIKYESKIKLQKIFATNCDFPGFEQQSDGEFKLNIKKDKESDTSEAGCEEKCKYVLQSAITFNKAKSHYMAYCRDEDSKEWYRYDDNQVRQIT